MKKLPLIILTMLLALLVAACGGGEPEGPQTQVITYSFSGEFVFDPATLTAKSGDNMRITLDNSNSSLEHSWILVPSGIDVAASPEEIEAQAVSADTNSGIIAVGDSKTINFTAPDPGAYEFVCTVAGHLAGGMVGKLTVTE